MSNVQGKQGVILVSLLRRCIWVGIATRYSLGGPGIESRWGRNFLNPSRWGLGPSQPPVKTVTGLFSGVEQPGFGVDHVQPSSAEVKERVELDIYSPFCLHDLF